MDISVVIPAYNEEGGIERLLRDVHKVFTGNGYKGDIVVVNDNSTDGTLGICTRLQKEIGNLRIITHTAQSGKTKAVIDGLKSIRTPYMLMIDADYQYDPFDIPKLVDKLAGGYAIVSGWRADRKDPAVRLLLSRFFNLIDRVMFGIRIHDINCGLKVFDVRVFRGIEFRFDNFLIDTELLAYVYKKSLPVAEVKIRHYPRSSDASKIKVIKSTAEIFLNCLQLKIGGNRLRGR